MDNKKIDSRIWINEGEKPFLGAGRVELLHAINKFGSISKAAKSMSMSYKKAWDLVDSMNKLGKEPLVVQKIGGKGGGGSTISQYGLTCITLFNEVQKANAKHVAKLNRKIKETL